MLYAAESFLLGSGDDSAVADQAGGGVAVKALMPRMATNDLSWRRRPPERRVAEPGGQS